MSNTEPDTTEYSQVVLALKNVSDVARFNNQAIRDFSERLKMINRMMQIVNETNINVLDSQYRFIVKEGVLRLATPGSKHFSLLSIYLFNDCVIFGRPSLSGLSTSYKKVSLSECRLRSSPSDFCLPVCMSEE